MKNTLNLILQGKGGVGKSLVAKVLAEYFNERGNSSENVDTDPVNKTFAKIQSLNVVPIDLIQNQAVSPQMFDSMVDIIINNKNRNFVIDNGSSCFLPLLKYINDNEFLELLEEQGINLVIHTVLSGGANEDDCLGGLETLQQLITNSNIKNKDLLAVWVNPYFGTFKSLENNTPLFDVTHIKDIFVLNSYDNDLYVSDFSYLNENRITHQEAMNSSNITFMSKRRIDSIYRSIFEPLDKFYLNDQLQKNKKGVKSDD